MQTDAFQSNIPARIDRLKWSRWHWRVLLALGVSWILDGVEVSTIGIIANVVADVFALSSFQVTLIPSMYLVGAVVGSLVSGVLADKYGRRKLFLGLPFLYGAGTFIMAISPSVHWGYYIYLLGALVVGLGIGGEYAAVSSAVNELVPSRLRGHVDAALGGSYWAGAVIGSLASVFCLKVLPHDVGWRIPIIAGSILAFGIVLLRLTLPESPRWLLTHGYPERAEDIVNRLEASQPRDASEELTFITIRRGYHPSLWTIIKEVVKRYKKQALLSLILMGAQAFFYNAIFFTYSVVLTDCYTRSVSDTPYYLIPFAVCNFLGAQLLGKLFDVVGRKRMISLTFLGSAILLAFASTWFYFSPWLVNDFYGAMIQTVAWSMVFFVASAAASGAYIVIAEVFPSEIRSLSIALFYAIGTGVGGVLGPLLYGFLINGGHFTKQSDPCSRPFLLGGYLLASVVMVIGSIAECVLGEENAGKSLEDIAAPIVAGENPPYGRGSDEGE